MLFETVEQFSSV